MRKLLFVLLAVVTSYAANASSTQMGHWRWRNDNGGEATATWKAAADQAITITDPMEPLRLRMSIYSHDNSGEYTLKLQYTADTANGTYWIGYEDETYWKDVPVEGDSVKGAPFSLIASPYVNSDIDTATTAQLDTSGNVDVAGRDDPFEPGALVTSASFGTTTILANKRYEVEFVLRATSFIQAGKTYIFRFKTIKNGTQNVPDHLDDYLSGVPKLRTAPTMQTVRNVSTTVIAYLGGPFNPATYTLNTAIADNNKLPKTFRYVTVPNINTLVVGGVKVTDWVTVQMARYATPNTPVYTTPALLMSDGSIVSPVAPHNSLQIAAVPGTFFILVRHRNHLAAAKKVTFDITSTNAIVNLSVGLTTPQKTIAGAKMLWPGDIDQNNEVGNADVSKVKTDFLNGLYGSYLSTDLDLNLEVGNADVGNVNTSFLNGAFLDYSGL